MSADKNDPTQAPGTADEAVAGVEDLMHERGTGQTDEPILAVPAPLELTREMTLQIRNLMNDLLRQDDKMLAVMSDADRSDPGEIAEEVFTETDVIEAAGVFGVVGQVITKGDTIVETTKDGEKYYWRVLNFPVELWDDGKHVFSGQLQLIHPADQGFLERRTQNFEYDVEYDVVPRFVL